MPAAKTSKNAYTTLYVKCTEPVEASVFDMTSFVGYLSSKFKPYARATAGVVGVTNPDYPAEKNKLAAGKSVIIGTNKAQDTVRISVKNSVSKAYIKFLVKKYLKKQKLRDHIRVVANNKKSLTLRFFLVQDSVAETD